MREDETLNTFEETLTSQIGKIKEHVAQYSDLWERFPESCVYCGDYWTDRDHLLPRNYTGEIYRLKTPTVRSCGRCNSLLSDVLMPDVEERALYVAGRERLHNKKMLNAKRWAQTDLTDFRGRLLRAVKNQMAQLQHLETRLSVLESGGLAGALRGY